MRTIPLVFVHTGNQAYLKTVIDQAKMYNEKVYLIGDNSNSSFCENWISINELSENRFNEFKKKYVHMSSNSKNFELGAIKRYFILYEFLKKYGYEEFINLDSDLLVYKNFSDMDWDKVDVALSIPQNQEPYNWTASLHCSYWKIQALKDFLGYLDQAYIGDIEKLKEKWLYHREMKIEGGICDMTLAYLWCQNQKIRIYNTAKIFNNAVFDHFLFSSEGYEEGEFKTSRLLEMKKVKFVNRLPYFYSNRQGWVRAYTIHAQGKRKMYINGLYRCRNGYLYYLSTKVRRTFRNGIKRISSALNH